MQRAFARRLIAGSMLATCAAITAVLFTNCGKQPEAQQAQSSTPSTPGPVAATPVAAAAAPANAAPAPQLAAADGVAAFHKDVEPMLQTYCYGCHGDGDKSGNIAFDELKTQAQILDPKLWHKVLKNTRANIMPPPSMPHPTVAEKEKLENWIKTYAFGSDPQNPDPGRVTLRRLNRNEYQNTIRDLLGVEYDVSQILPKDDVGYGFDNIGDVLNISPLRMEKYMEAAITIVDQVVPKDTVSMTTRKGIGEEFLSEDGRNANAMSFYTSKSASKTFTVDKPGEYVFWWQVKIDGDTSFDPQEVIIHVSSDGKEFFSDKYVYADVKYFNNERVLKWDAGEHTITFTTEPANPELRPLRTKMDYRLMTWRLDGPLDRKHWEHPPGYKTIYTREAPPSPTDVAGRRAYAKEVLGKFASKAYRRPIDEETLNQLVDLAEKTYTVPNTTFEQGIGQAIVAILSSPRFLFHMEYVEAAAQGQKYPRLDEYSLAQRLSYTLWCTIPDEELTALAAKGELRKNMQAQVDRMLKDPKASAFVEAFSNQWLQTRAIIDISINSADILAAESETPAAPAAAAGPADPAAGAFAGRGAAGAPGDPAAAGAFGGRGAGRAGRGAGAVPPGDPAVAGAPPAGDPAAPGAFGGRGAGRAGRGAGAPPVGDPAFAGAPPAGDPAAAGRGAGRAGRGAAGDPAAAAGAGRAGRGAGGRGGRGGRGGPVFDGMSLIPEVRTAMKQEVEAYFKYIVSEDRSVDEFIHSDYTFVNAALAPVYNIQGVTGMEMRKVQLPPNDPRGGVITMGSVLTVTSNPTRTSPVKRGKWIMENILGTPPPPAPPNIPALEETLKKGDADHKLTQREALAMHRENPMCASCHSRMDPLGLALENFNGFGRFRTMEFQQPIEPSGELATGEKFNGIIELKKTLLEKHKQEFYHAITEKLMTYALGRGVEYYDLDTMDQIVNRMNKENGKFSALLMGVLESAPFQQRRPTPAEDKIQTASSNKGE